jgi:gas vesicle protein
MKFSTGLILGLVVGFALGLLLAPQSGEDTRALLSEQGITLNTGGLADEIRARASAALAQGREVYNTAKNELSQRYNQAKSGNM